MIRIHWRNSDGQVAEFLARARDVTGSPQGRGDYVAYREDLLENRAFANWMPIRPWGYDSPATHRHRLELCGPDPMNSKA